MADKTFSIFQTALRLAPSRKYTHRPIRNCLVCGKETKNKKYCSQKCNAQVSNNLKKFWLNGGTPWRTGLTKETCPSIARASEASSRTKLERNLPTWNKGLTKETDERVRRNALGVSKGRKEGFRTGRITAWQTGQTKETNESIARAGRNISKTRIEKKIPVWNKGLTKETDSRLECTPQARVTLLFYAKQPKTDNWKQQRKDYMLAHWQDPDKRDPHLRNIFKMLKNRVIPIPNSQEILLNSILDEFFPGQWEFVGDGKSIVGTKSPDFISTNGRKEIIELYGDYWHRDDNPQDRIDYFKNYGYSALIIWNYELKDENRVVERIKEWQKSLTYST